MVGLYFILLMSQLDYILSLMDIISLGMLQMEVFGYVDILQLGEFVLGFWDVRFFILGVEVDNGLGEWCY